MGAVSSICSSAKGDDEEVEIKDTASALNEVHAGLEARDHSFYDRKYEIEGLITILCDVPKTITVISGPKDCGKTSVVEHLQKVWGEAPLHVYSPFLVVSLRKMVCQVPDAFLVALRTELRSWKQIALSLLEGAKSLAIGPVRIGMILDGLKTLEQTIADNKLANFAAIQATLLDYAGRLPGVTPVLVFDEANLFRDWEVEHAKELEDLFLFMLYLVRSKKVHVVLTTSDCFFQRWVVKHLRSTDFTNHPFGFFGEEAAKGFVKDHLRMSYPGFEEQLEAAWPDCYKHAGGCPVTLTAIMVVARSAKSLVDAIDLSRSRVRDDMVALLAEVDGDEKKLLKLLLRSGGVLPLPLVLEAGTDGETIDRLVERNILHLRQWWSDGNWIQDMGCTRQPGHKSYLMFAKPAMREGLQIMLPDSAQRSLQCLVS